MGNVHAAVLWIQKDVYQYTVQMLKYIRPHLEFAAAAWSPWHASDKDLIEKIQRRAVSMISGLQGKSYEEKLKEEITSLLPTGIGERFSQNISNLEQAALLRRCELPL
jgi:hypothetical protein